VAKPVAIPVARTTALVHPSKGSLVVGKGLAWQKAKANTNAWIRKQFGFAFPIKTSNYVWYVY